MKVGKSDNVDIAVTEEQANMDEVVVIGYGKMKKTDLSSAVVTISNADIQKTVNVTLDEALQGKAPNGICISNQWPARCRSLRSYKGG